MIPIKTPEEIKIITEGGRILAKIMKELEKKAKPGITTKELDRVAEALISCPPKPWGAKADKIPHQNKFGTGQVKCSFKGYDGFPACLCTSINEEVVHAVPSVRRLKSGDVFSLDLGIFYKGFHTDMAITIPITKPGNVEKINPEALRLIRVTKKALKWGIKEVQPGKTFGDVGNAIQKYVESQGFNVVRDLCGHGIGRDLHEEPQILNYGKRRTGPELVEGMVFCLEPMVTIGDWKIKKSQDGHGWETADGSLSAHFEHTVAVTKDGCQVLTNL